MRVLNANFKQVTQAIVNAPIESSQHQSYSRSPLRYPGGKSRAVPQIMELLPQGLDKICSPFIGGGSVELACAARGIQVSAYDGFEPLVNFWQIVFENAPQLAKLVEAYHPLSRTEFYALQKRYFDIAERMEKAAAFFVLNRASFSGTTLSGGMSPGHKRFTKSAIERLDNFTAENITIEHADFRESIPDNSGKFLYLDPPYANGGRLYGERGDMHDSFGHKALSEILYERDGWILSYNDCDMVHELYPDNTFVKAEWAYGMNNSRTSNEVIILSQD
jgi:DNA adenine methylase